jgi:predicted transposase YbfD/YdcC
VQFFDRLRGIFLRSNHHSLHWVLSVTFKEDESQEYAENGAKNMALFIHALLNSIKVHPLKNSVAGKMM